MSRRGAYVTFDGGEGTGKSTQALALAERTGAMPIREPGNTRAGAFIRSILLDFSSGELTPEAEVLLFSADRNLTFNQVTQPTLSSGRSVISDRSYLSTIAYQHAAHGIADSYIETATNLALGARRADRQVIFDLDYETAVERMAAQGRVSEADRFERLGETFHNKVRTGFLELAKNLGSCAILIDVSGTREEVQTELYNHVGELLIEGVQI